MRESSLILLFKRFKLTCCSYLLCHQHIPESGAYGRHHRTPGDGCDWRCLFNKHGSRDGKSSESCL